MEPTKVERNKWCVPEEASDVRCWCSLLSVKKLASSGSRDEKKNRPRGSTPAIKNVWKPSGCQARHRGLGTRDREFPPIVQREGEWGARKPAQILQTREGPWARHNSCRLLSSSGVPGSQVISYPGGRASGRHATQTPISVLRRPVGRDHGDHTANGRNSRSIRNPQPRTAIKRKN